MAQGVNLKRVILTPHAEWRMSQRGIAPQDVSRVLARPDAVLPVRAGRIVAQAVQGEFLFRVFVDVDRDPPEVVTVYRTGKLDKYRSPS